MVFFIWEEARALSPPPHKYAPVLQVRDQSGHICGSNLRALVLLIGEPNFNEGWIMTRVVNALENMRVIIITSAMNYALNVFVKMDFFFFNY
jgi:hypothetical protein